MLRGRGLRGPEHGGDVLSRPREAAGVALGQEEPREEVLQQRRGGPGPRAATQPQQSRAPGAGSR